MTTTSEVVSKVDNFLCKRGLAKAGTIVTAAQESPEVYGYAFGEIDTDVLAVLRNDDAAIREAFNLRHGPVELTDPAARAAELSARAELFEVLVRLHRVAHRLNQGLERRPLASSEVVTAMATLARLRFTCHLPLEEIALYCERKAIEDGETVLHTIDPLQIRHILTAHRRISRERLGEDVIAALKTATISGNAEKIRAWFKTERSRPSVNAELGQIARSVLAEAARVNATGLAALAQEIAIHEIAQFSELGWESARAFFSLSAQMFAAKQSALDVYMTRDEIQEAIVTREWLGDTAALQHFKTRLGLAQANKLEELRRAMASAAERRSQPAASVASVVVAQTAHRRPHFLLRAIGWNAHAA
ncbi:MAG TPA: hypothetical protein VFT72_07480 [Opitutaceae bacterium]|nr:hypothetical protein [Opitutaceae bacterium]